MIKKCSDTSMEMLLPALLGNDDRPHDQQTDGRFNREATL